MHSQKGRDANKKEILIKADQLIKSGRHEEALNLIRSIEDTGEVSLIEKISCNLLRCRILNQQGLIEDIRKLAESTYKDSLKLGKNILSVDSLIILARALIRLIELEEAFATLKKSKEMLDKLEDISPIESQKREATINLEIGRYYEYTLELDLSVGYLSRSLELQERLGDELGIAISKHQLAWTVGVFKGETERGIQYLEESLTTFKKYNNKHHLARALNMMAAINSYKGNLDEAILLYEQSYVIHKQLNNKASMSAILSNMANAYILRKDLDLALECSKKSLNMFEELRLPKRMFLILDTLIQILIEKGDLEQAKRYFNKLELLKNQFPENFVNLIYHFNKTLLLKASPMAYDRDKAEYYLKQMVRNEDLVYEFKVKSLLHLCDLLITKLSLMSSLEILDQILFYVDQIKTIAINSSSFWLLAETYLFKSKIDLFKLDFEKSKKSFEKAQEIVNEKKLSYLNERMQEEKENLFNKINKWISLKVSTNTALKTSNLIILKEQVHYMLKKRELLKTVEGL